MHRLHESAFCHQFFRFLSGHDNDLEILGGVQMLAADFLAVRDQIAVGAIADARCIWCDLAEKCRLALGVTCLLEEFSRGSGARIGVRRLHTACRKFQKDLSCSMAVLAHENEIPVPSDSDHNDKIRHNIYIKRRDLCTVRQCTVIGMKIDPAVFYDRP